MDIKKIKIMLVDFDFILETSPAKKERNLSNPIFKEEKFVLPKGENEYLEKSCNIIFRENIEDIVECWEKIGWLNRLNEVQKFIGSCCNLSRPLKEIRMEEDRQVWQAYIDGMTALNNSKKELFKIKSIGKINKGQDYRGRKIKKITIELDDKNQSENLKNDILHLFEREFETLPEVFITPKQIKIEYNSYRIIPEDLLNGIEDIVNENCYAMVENQPTYHLMGTINLKIERSDFDSAKKEINKELESFGAKFEKKEDKYIFHNDDDIKYFGQIVSTKYSNYINQERSSSLIGKIYCSNNPNIESIENNIKRLDGVIQVREAQGYIVVKSNKELNLSDKEFSNLLFSSCRIELIPKNFNPSVSVLGTLETKGRAYYSTITDIRKVSLQPTGWKYSIINSYKKSDIKTWVDAFYYYALKPSIDKTLLRPLQLHFYNNEKINVNSVKGEIELLPINCDDYKQLQEEVAKALPENLSIEYPEYSVSINLIFLLDNMSMRERTFNAINNSLSCDIKFNRYSFLNNDKSSITFDVLFKTEEERDRYKIGLFNDIRMYENLVSLNFSSSEGSTIIICSLDSKLLDERNKNLNKDFRGETVNYVSPEYDTIRTKFEKNFQEEKKSNEEFTNQQVDGLIEQEQKKFKKDAPLIGKCLFRTPESVTIEVDDTFIEKLENREIKFNGGYLQFPVLGSSAELYRQQNAMKRITNPGEGNGKRKIEYPVNRNLPNFLFDPRYTSDIEEDIEVEKAKIRQTLIESELNDKQLEAVTKAVLAKDMAFIQGPPGTGKTTVIAEIIWQEVIRNKDCRILLTSQTNTAVDNALERLQGKRGVKAIRIVTKKKTDFLEREGRRYLLPLMEEWKNTGSKEPADNAVNIWIDTIHGNISNNAKYSEVLSQWKKDLETKDEYIRQIFFQHFKSKVNLIAATCSICGSTDFLSIYQALYGTTRAPEFDVVIMDEASKATPLEMAVPMVLGKKIIVIGDHKQLPPMMDENSIDTALKKIDRNDLAKKIEDIKESQFKKLFEAAQKVRKNLVATLDTQYRMHEQIMLTINHFYNDDLNSGLQCGIKATMDDPNLKNKGSRYHGFDFKNILRPNIHALWVNVHNHEKQEGSSFSNSAELDAIRLIVEALVHCDGYSHYIESFQKPEDKEIGLITFYGAQKRHLKEMQKNGSLGKSSFTIDVVDRFQGMEKNIVIVSTVRSNDKNNFGFASRIERINVAFSRAKRLLIVVGDKQFFESNDNYRKSIAAMEVVDIKQLKDALK